MSPNDWGTGHYSCRRGRGRGGGAIKLLTPLNFLIKTFSTPPPSSPSVIKAGGDVMCMFFEWRDLFSLLLTEFTMLWAVVLITVGLMSMICHCRSKVQMKTFSSRCVMFVTMQISGEHWRDSQLAVGPQDSFVDSHIEIVPSSLITVLVWSFTDLRNRQLPHPASQSLVLVMVVIMTIRMIMMMMMMMMTTINT